MLSMFIRPPLSFLSICFAAFAALPFITDFDDLFIRRFDAAFDFADCRYFDTMPLAFLPLRFSLIIFFCFSFPMPFFDYLMLLHAFAISSMIFFLMPPCRFLIDFIFLDYA